MNHLKFKGNNKRNQSKIRSIKNRKWIFSMNHWSLKFKRKRRRGQILSMKRLKMKIKMMNLMVKRMMIWQRNRNMKFFNNSMRSINKILSISLKIKESFLKENLKISLQRARMKKWNKKMNECKLKDKLSFQMAPFLKEKKMLRTNLNMIRNRKKILKMKRAKMKTLLKNQSSILKPNKLNSNNQKVKMRKWRSKLIKNKWERWNKWCKRKERRRRQLKDHRARQSNKNDLNQPSKLLFQSHLKRRRNNRSL